MTSYPISRSDPAPQCSGSRILIASPSSVIRKRVLETLSRPVQHCEQASGGAEALVRLERGSWQILYLDRRLPDLDAAELSQTVRQRFPEVEVVLLDEDLDPGKEVRVSLPSDGAISQSSSKSFGRDEGEFVTRWSPPLEPEFRSFGLPSSLPEYVLATDRADPVVEQPADPMDKPLHSSFCAEMISPSEPLPGMIGNSAVMQPVYRLIRLLAKRTTTVLVTGPTGSGKELVARAIHQLSPRSQRGFAVVNCAAIPETLLEAELFGYARGAFTGAMQAYAGRIQAAHGGTLFLDEIGEMPLSLQPKLLRFLEQKEVQRLGSSEVVRVDARIVSATNAHLLSLVKEGKFREDLYYRLCGFPVDIPALRERGDDIALLAAHFLQKFSQAVAPRSSAPQLSSAARQLLETQPWPGNIRELQNVMERALILAENRSVIRPEHLMLNLSHTRNFN